MHPTPTEPAPDAPTPPVSAEPAPRDTAPEVLDASGTTAAPDAPNAPDEVVIPAPIVTEPYPYPGIPAAWEAPAQAYRDAVDAWLRADLEHHARAAHADEIARIRREAVHTSADAGEARAARARAARRGMGRRTASVYGPPGPAGRTLQSPSCTRRRSWW